MTAPRDIDRRIQAFFDEGFSELPATSYDAVRVRIEGTRQLPAVGLWKELTVPRIAISALAAAAVLVIAILGATLLPSRVAGPGTSPTPSPSPSPTAAATAALPSPSAGLSYTWPGRLAAGRYSTSFTWDVPFEIGFTVPDGWSSRDVEVTRDPLINLAFALVGNVAVDPCARTLADPPIGDTVDDLAAAIGAMPGLDASAPRPATLAGFDGLAIDAAVASDAGCDPIDFLMWVDPEGWHLPVRPFGPPTWTAEQRNMTIRILDVDGTRLVVSQLWSDDATEADRAELQAVLDSVEIGPPTQTFSIGSCQLIVTHHGKDLGSPPYEITLGFVAPETLNGPYPVDWTLPLDWLDWQGSGWSMMGRGRPGGAGIIPPPGVTSNGFATRNQINGPQVGSFVFDAPGVWWARISDNRLSDSQGCLRQFPVTVLPAG